ncbi:MAG: hypothetical protein KDE58_40145 [Caldilineaceae bacterium]|nr:hypothetical protein [Caldilineaceae bacterium]
MSTFMSKLISPMGLVVLICFFLPWITISCGNMPVINEASAMDIATGLTVNGQTQEGNSLLYLSLVGGAILVFTGLGLWNAKNSPASVGALIGAVIVLVVWFLFRKNLQDGVNEAAAQGFVLNHQWEMGFWGTFIGGVVGGIGALFSFGERDQ